jgi:MFS family permease
MAPHRKAWTLVLASLGLAFACLLLTGAALGDRFGRRRTFCVGLGGFTLASAVAAVGAGLTAAGIAAALVAPRAVRRPLGAPALAAELD